MPAKLTMMYGSAREDSVSLPESAIASISGRIGVNNANSKETATPDTSDALNTPPASSILRFPRSTAASAAPPMASIMPGICSSSSTGMDISIAAIASGPKRLPTIMPSTTLPSCMATVISTPGKIYWWIFLFIRNAFLSILPSINANPRHCFPPPCRFVKH